MTNLFKKSTIGAIFALMACGLWSGAASANTMELALLLDGSGSINNTAWQEQLLGYKNAFASGSFYDTYVAPSPFDTLVVSVYQFGTNVTQEIGWTQINNNTDATNFGNLFTFSQDQGWTVTSGAIYAATQGILTNGYSSSKAVIDISTDGNPTWCYNTTTASSYSCSQATAQSQAIVQADAARSNGIVLNAIGVGSGINSTFLDALVGINPVSTPTGFYLQATDFSTFGSTLETKLGREIKVPEPATILLLGIGLLGLGLLGLNTRRQVLA